MDLSLQKDIAVWRLRRWKEDLSWPWLAAGGLLAFSVGFYLSMVAPLLSDVQNRSQRLQALQSEVRTVEQAPGRLRQLTSQGQLETFYRFFPSERSIPDWIEKISVTAARNRLVLREAEYQVMRDRNSRLLMYQVTLPVKGSYPDLRGFIEDVLTEIPAASLDNVRFERQKIGEESLVSTVQFTLHLGSES